MALAGKGICWLTGVDSLGGYDLTTDAVLNGLGYAIPPMMALLFIMDVRANLCYNFLSEIILGNVH